MIHCPYKYYFGIECLGCGLQRSIYSIFKFELVQSIQFFPGLFPLILFLILEVFYLFGFKSNRMKLFIFIFGISAFVIQLITFSLRFLGFLPSLDHIV